MQYVVKTIVTTALFQNVPSFTVQNYKGLPLISEFTPTVIESMRTLCGLEDLHTHSAQKDKN